MRLRGYHELSDFNYPWAISKNDVDTVAIVKLRYTDGVAVREIEWANR